MNPYSTTKHAKNITEAILRLMIERRGEWIKSYEFVQKHLYGKFTGTSADRRARELAEKGYGELDGFKFFVERRKVGKYSEYRCVGGQKTQTRYEFITNPNGEEVAVPVQETLKI